MATTRSAGIMLYRRLGGEVEVLVAHMGGPFWARKDEAAWSIPKGEYGPNEQPEAAARREFVEELGLDVPSGPLAALGEVRQPSGKRLVVWALEGDLDVDAVRPGTFEMQWPPHSGRRESFPEVDRAQWVAVPVARVRLVQGQRVFLDRLLDLLRAEPG